MALVFLLFPVIGLSQDLKVAVLEDAIFPEVQLGIQGDLGNLSTESFTVVEDGNSIQLQSFEQTEEGWYKASYQSSFDRDGDLHEASISYAGQNQTFMVASSEPFYSWYDLLSLLGALGLFLFGMKVMSEGIQKAAGEKLRDILGAVTKNRFLGIFTGFLVTAIIQSSSATTVMIVSFANAGLFNLTQSIGVIMGANIGTTVTAWIISLLGFSKFSLASISLPLLGISFPFLYLSNDKVKSWAEFIIGFAILFIGLSELKDSVPDIKNNPEMLSFLRNLTGMGFWSLIIFVFIGTLLTIIVQSSSASMALTLVFLANGWIDFQTGAALVLGENIGTTITAQLAALVANLQAKRAAMAHTIFNVLGIIWMFLLFTPFLKMVDWLMGVLYGWLCQINPSVSDLCGQNMTLFPEDGIVGQGVGTIGLTLFHTSFNLVNTMLLIWFVPQIQKAVTYLVRENKTSKPTFMLKYLDSGLMSTPELALAEVAKEIKEFGQLALKMYRYDQMLTFRQPDKHKKILKRIEKLEDESDMIELEVAEYLSRLSMENVSSSSSKRIRSMFSMIDDLERVADLCEALSKSLNRKQKLNIEFADDSERGLKEMYKLVEEAFDLMITNLASSNPEKDLMDKAREIESAINDKRNGLRREEYIRIENGSTSFQAGLIFIDIISTSEKIADHIFNVNEATAGIK